MAPEPDQLIRSRDNQNLKYIRSLRQRSTRERERAFVVEGVRGVEDALTTGAIPSLIAVREGFVWDGLGFQRHARIVRLESRLFDSLAETETPQPLLAVFPCPSPATVPGGPELQLIVDGVRDPGNFGTMIRSAAAAGASSVRFTSGTVDPFNGKCVRAAMGAHFRIAIHPLTRDWLNGFKLAGNRVVVCEANAATAYDELDLTVPVAIVIGGEAYGVSAELAEHATDSVSIPLDREVESLNAGVAASVVLFEAARQRRQHGKM